MKVPAFVVVALKDASAVALAMSPPNVMAPLPAFNEKVFALFEFVVVPSVIVPPDVPIELLPVILVVVPLKLTGALLVVSAPSKFVVPDADVRPPVKANVVPL